MIAKKTSIVKKIKNAEATEKQLIKVTQLGVDSEAAWITKAGRLHYGYKKHLCTDDADGMITSCESVLFCNGLTISPPKKISL